APPAPRPYPSSRALLGSLRLQRGGTIDVRDETSRSASEARVLAPRAVRVLDLDGRVLDREDLLQARVEAVEEVVARALAHDDVRGEDRQARGEAPDVEVVDVGHAVHRADLALDRAVVETGWRPLQEDVE